MKKSIIFLIIFVIILFSLYLIFIQGVGIHTIYKAAYPQTDINYAQKNYDYINRNIVVDEEWVYFGILKGHWISFDAGNSLDIIPWITLYKGKRIFSNCEITYEMTDIEGNSSGMFYHYNYIAHCADFTGLSVKTNLDENELIKHGIEVPPKVPSSTPAKL